MHYEVTVSSESPATTDDVNSRIGNLVNAASAMGLGINPDPSVTFIIGKYIHVGFHLKGRGGCQLLGT